MNTQTTMKTINGQTIITRESIPDDMYVNESLKDYLYRIGAMKSPSMTEEKWMQEHNRDDTL